MPSITAPRPTTLPCRRRPAAACDGGTTATRRTARARPARGPCRPPTLAQALPELGRGQWRVSGRHGGRDELECVAGGWLGS